MNVVELIVMVCSLSNPNACSEKHFLFEANGSLNGCIMQAQPYLAQWAGEHPNDRVASFRCAWPEQEGQTL
ncbi:MAG: hypothetical protein JWQ55_6255 [Rhodopila sp.]|nr:hypothetical protein [Rhodopila sp.]